MATQFTDEQQLAIDTRGCDLLVSAAAGSGKTAVLIERLIQMITNSQKPVELDRLLVVTFTEAAALEMRQRLGKALRERLRAEPQNAYLHRQMMLLPAASITTIHSFCLQVIRRFFTSLGIDPSFRVADEAETALLKIEITRALFEELYELTDEARILEICGEGGMADFRRLVEFYGNSIKDDALQKLVQELYEFSRSKPWPDRWLLAQAESFRVPSVKALAQTEWYVFFRDETLGELKELREALAAALILAQNPNIHAGYIDTLHDDIASIRLAERALAEDGLDAFIRAMNQEAFGRLPSAKSKTQDGAMTEDDIKALKESIQEIRNDVKKNFGELRKNAAFKSADGMCADLNDLYGVMRALAGVVNEFAAQFSREKRKRNIADFSDFEHLCLQALLAEGSTEDNPMPTAEALALQARFDEVLIDEYQDSNLVQELILRSVSRKDRGMPNRFMVGDMKQSIYRFRMANPELFRQKYHTYARETGGLERLIGLAKNFRSRDGVLDGINLICKQMMDEQLGDVAYDENAMLYFGASYPPYQNEHDRENELLLIETDSDDEQEEDDTVQEETLPALTSAEAEARTVAARIDALVNGKSPYQVSTKEGGYRPVEYRDIVILLRSPGVLGSVYMDELKRLGIPSYAGTSKGYFEALEVLTMLSFLQIIDNPRQDLHLLTALHSPVYAFTADELVRIRACAGGLFYDALLASLENDSLDDALRVRIAIFLSHLERWRDMAILKPISELVQTLYDETGYYRSVGVMTGGQVRRANLTALYERAVQYEKTSLKGLFHFIRYIERLQKSGQDMGDAKTAGENENVVRIMSVHKSKGLEFPVVFVSGMGRAFNMLDIRAPLLTHAAMGFGPKHVDLENRVVSPTLRRYAVSQKIRRENLSEELRLLYVALTRAREKLVITAAVKSIAAVQQKLVKLANEPALVLPNALRFRAKRFSDWILPALARHRDMAAFIGIESASCAAVWNDPSRWCILLTSKAEAEQAEQKAAGEAESLGRQLHVLDGADYSGQKDEIARRLRYIYPAKGAALIPSKMSVSEVKRMHYAATLADSADFLAPSQKQSFLRVPRLALDDMAPDAARRGALLHTVLEHIDFALDMTKEAIAARVVKLTEGGFIRAEDVPYLDTAAIFAFLHSPIADRIRQSDDVRREVQFVAEEKPNDIFAGWSGEIDTPVIVHGVIDLIFREGDAFVLVDYKTDRFQLENLDEVAARYAPQLALYKSAVRRFAEFAVKETILYFFSRQIEKSVI